MIEEQIKEKIKDFNYRCRVYDDVHAEANYPTPDEELAEDIKNLLTKSNEEAVRGLWEYHYHYWRECHNCGYAGNSYLHCMHDGVQSKCTKCREVLPTFDGECECDFVITEKDTEEYLQSLDKGDGE